MDRDTTTRAERAAHLLLVVGVVTAAAVWTLGFPRTPEGWSQLALLRERSIWGACLPFEEYPYYRPLWFFWLSVSDRAGLSGGAAHVGPLAMHVVGTLCVYGSLVRFDRRFAVCAALLAGVAPGLAAALSWLAAGNKAFVFAFLSIGTCILMRRRDAWAYPLAILFGVVPAVASSENGYMACALFPFVILVLRRQSGESVGVRIASAFGTGVAAIAISAVHLFVLSPQRGAGSDDRLAQLQSAWLDAPLDAALSLAENLGRFFLHGIGVADDAPRIGAVVLLLLLVGALVLRWRGVVVALLVFGILNVPATLFPGESSRHQAYLPAVGAGLVVASVLWQLPQRGLGVVFAALFFTARGFEYQRPWSDYCQQSARVFASSVEALPQFPVRPPLLVNVPEEYRAAFHLRFGDAAGVGKWPAVTILTSRSEALLPDGWSAPEETDADSVVLEYDGDRIVRSSLAKIAARQRAPRAWWVTSVDRFERPWLAWRDCIRGADRLTGTARGFRASTRASVVDLDTLSKREQKVSAHGLLEGEIGLYWDVAIGDGPAGWLVLGWTPLSGMPTTENAWLFTLAPLPWLFELRLLDRDGATGSQSMPQMPVFGFLPAVWCESGARSFRAELRLRKT